MLQESGFSPDLTVKESVRMIGTLSRRRDRVERVLDIVDLTHKAGTKVSQLSGGEKRRLDFATAVYGNPELIFLDEPTTGLDIQSRDALWDAVQTNCAKTDPPLCSPRTTWRRPRRAPIASGSCTRAPSTRRGPSPS
ncbi:hypothetical protein SPURM210S_07965 [Streptomyces purpurascens]